LAPMRKAFLAGYAVIALGFAGCAQSGHPFDPSLVNQLTPGVSTEADAISLLGTPTAITIGPTGNRGLVWTHAASVFVSTHVESVGLVFGPDHRMLRVASVMAVN
jgi:hypothetical protein